MRFVSTVLLLLVATLGVVGMSDYAQATSSSASAQGPMPPAKRATEMSTPQTRSGATLVQP